MTAPTAEERAKHLSIKRLVCGCGEADCPRYAKVVEVIRVAEQAAVAARDAEWREAVRPLYCEYCAPMEGPPALQPTCPECAPLRALLRNEALRSPEEG